MIKKVDMNIWGRDFDLKVEFDCYRGEKVTKSKEEALKKIIKNIDLINKSKKMLEKYCEKSVYADNENQKKDNVFSYIKPDYIFVKREDKPRVAIMCKYKYDMEHGLAIVFEESGNITIELQDEIL